MKLMKYIGVFQFDLFDAGNSNLSWMFGGLFVWSISCALSQVWTDSQQMRIIVSLEFTLPMIHGGLQSPRTVHYYDHQGSFSQFSYKSYEILDIAILFWSFLLYFGRCFLLQ